MAETEINQVLSQLRELSQAAKTQPTAGQPQVQEGDQQQDFAALLKGAVDQVNTNQQQAGKMTEAFESGESDVELAEVMVALQKARVSFETMLQARNKLVSAYKDIMNMRI